MQFREQVCKTLRLVEDRTHLLKSRPINLPRHLAAAGLVRCCALLRGICVLEDAGLPALTGILERQNWETWLVSQSILLRGDEAVDEIAGDYVKSTTTLVREASLGPEYVPDWEGNAKKLNVAQLAEKLRPLLVDAGDTEGADLTRGYTGIYRGQSQFTVHTGISTLNLYTRFEGEWASIEPNPPTPFPDVGNVSLLCTAHLAWHVFKRFGIATREVESVWARIRADLNERSA